MDSSTSRTCFAPRNRRDVLWRMAGSFAGIFLTACLLTGVRPTVDIQAQIRQALEETLSAQNRNDVPMNPPGSTEMPDNPAVAPSPTATQPEPNVPEPTPTPTVTATRTPLPTHTPTATTEHGWKTFHAVVAECGQVWEDGAVSDFTGVGDDSNNRESQAFLSFDISSFPDHAVIDVTDARFYFEWSSLGDDPFAHNSYLAAFEANYETLHAGLFFSGPPRFSDAELILESEVDDRYENSTATELMRHINNITGADRLQLRFQFVGDYHPNDDFTYWLSDNNQKDRLVIDPYNTRIEVEYSARYV